jgi:four helix bundle protein
MMPHERLKAWQKCHELFLAVYLASREWPKEETYGFISQARKASYSAAANIVEGSARQGPREFRGFLDISVGSLRELSYIFRAVRDLELSPPAVLESLEQLRESASKLTWRLYEAIKRKSLLRHPSRRQQAPRPPSPPSPPSPRSSLSSPYSITSSSGGGTGRGGSGSKGSSGNPVTPTTTRW